MEVTPSNIFNSAAVEVTPSNIFNSAVVEVTPSIILSSAAVAVTPSMIFNSAAVEVIVVLAMDKASVSRTPSTSTFPDISKDAAATSPLNVPVVVSTATDETSEGCLPR